MGLWGMGRRGMIIRIKNYLIGRNNNENGKSKREKCSEIIFMTLMANK